MKAGSDWKVKTTVGWMKSRKRKNPEKNPKNPDTTDHNICLPGDTETRTRDPNVESLCFIYLYSNYGSIQDSVQTHDKIFPLLYSSPDLKTDTLFFLCPIKSFRVSECASYKNNKTENVCHEV